MSARMSWAAAFATLAAVACAHANDSTAKLDAGGLALTYNPAIRMEEEDLYLSEREVRVRYRFLNTSNADIETLVAFPLPEIETGEGGNYAIESSDPINFIGFRVTVDGRPLTPSVQAKATSLGVDITSLLEKYGLPITTIVGTDRERAALNDKLTGLPEHALRELEKYGAIDRLSSSRAGVADVNPRWSAHIAFYWFQTFPARRAIEVTHRYKPVPRNFFTGLEELGGARMRKDYCVDEPFLAAARKRADSATLTGLELRYILSTARNWAGPIGSFRLTLDKGSPARVASTCFSGLKQSGPTTFVAEKKDFMADEDLGVLLLWRTPNE